MVCIYCKKKTHVFNSRYQKRSNSKWRRRKCTNCGFVFTSIETIKLSDVLMVKKSSSHLEPFSETKILISIFDSLKHRKSATEDAESLSATILNKIYLEITSSAISTDQIKKIALSTLRLFDDTAAVYYQAYY